MGEEMDGHTTGKWTTQDYDWFQQPSRGKESQGGTTAQHEKKIEIAGN
jgi:hypothetical protein